MKIKKKKGGNWECHKSGLKDILSYILSGPLGRYSSFFDFSGLFFRFPPISFFSRSSCSFFFRISDHQTPLENFLLYAFSLPSAHFAHIHTRGQEQLSSSWRQTHNNRVISHCQQSSQLGDTSGTIGVLCMRILYAWPYREASCNRPPSLHDKEKLETWITKRITALGDEKKVRLCRLVFEIKRLFQLGLYTATKFTDNGVDSFRRRGLQYTRVDKQNF